MRHTTKNYLVKKVKHIYAVTEIYGTLMKLLHKATIYARYHSPSVSYDFVISVYTYV